MRKAPTVIPSPCLVGESAIVKQAVLLTPDLGLLKPSQNTSFQWYILSLLPVTVAGPRRRFTGLPY